MILELQCPSPNVHELLYISFPVLSITFFTFFIFLFPAFFTLKS